MRWREYARDWGVSALLALVGGSLLELVGEVVSAPEAAPVREAAPPSTLVPTPEAAPTSMLVPVLEVAPVPEARPEGEVPPSAHRVVRDIEDIIAREAASDLTVTTIAKRVFVSANYASRLYKQSTGRTITEAMILARVERAKELLAERSPIKAFQVGELVGYPDPVYFTKLFKRCVGMTPKQYREMNLTSPNADKKLG
ncbi:MAG: AraC family transcriptional regulator [Firmicutes bacterium]|nr:AraC family transcriptional regulator [Bacillota bacterium]